MLIKICDTLCSNEFDSVVIVIIVTVFDSNFLAVFNIELKEVYICDHLLMVFALISVMHTECVTNLD